MNVSRWNVLFLFVVFVTYMFPPHIFAVDTDSSSMEWLANESRLTPISSAEQTPTVGSLPDDAQLAFHYPLATRPIITTPFSLFHRGVDYAAPRGSAIFAAESGMVTQSGQDTTGYGLTIVIHHTKTIYTRYAHLTALNIGLGQFVTKGTPIGSVGCTGHCTGPHVHMEVNVNGQFIDPQVVVSF